MKVLITGDRNWTSAQVIREVLIRIKAENNEPITFIHGNARGADRIGAAIAESLGMEVKSFPAQWGIFGRAAGPIRNAQMLDENPNLVIAFHNDLSSSKGTRHCVMEARRRGHRVELYHEFEGAIVVQ